MVVRGPPQLSPPPSSWAAVAIMVPLMLITLITLISDLVVRTFTRSKPEGRRIARACAVRVRAPP